jgi:hypothetical protein
MADMKIDESRSPPHLPRDVITTGSRGVITNLVRTQRSSGSPELSALAQATTMTIEASTAR